jgi:WD repeat-containing protein 89
MSASLISPSRTVVTNFSSSSTGNGIIQDNYDEGVWVLDSCSGSAWFGCTLSNGNIHVYDHERLQSVQSYISPHGNNQITDLSSDSFNGLITSSKNGSVCLFDVRQATPALKFDVPRNEQALSVDLGYGGALAAIGSSKAHIHFFDLRDGGKLLGSYVDAHTDEVTRVRFQATNSGETTSLLISGSEDGLSCIFDTSQPSEEAALQGVLNVQAPLRRVGFFGPSSEGVYCLTGSETLSVWHHDTAQRICDFGPALRTDLSELATVQVDYLVDCFWDASKQHLSLLTGSHAGDGTVFQVDAGKISPRYKLQNGHRGDIRSWSHIQSGDVFVTVGEDARLCEWNRTGFSTTSTNQPKGAPQRRQKKQAKGYSNPY